MEPQQQQSTAHEGVAPQPALSQADMLTVYGPLGIGWAITLAIVAVLWRDGRAQRREFLAELARRDAQCKAERDEFRDTFIVVAREQNEAGKSNTEKWRDHARELRTSLDSLGRRIGSKE